MLTVVLLYALFAGSFTMGKALVVYISPMLLIGLRMSVAGSLLLAYQHIFPTQSFKIRSKDILIYIQLALFAIFIPYTTRMWALQTMSGTKACLLNSAGPFISYIMEIIFFKERPSARKIFGLLIGLLGILVILFGGTPLEHVAGSIWFLSWPEIAMIISVISVSYGWVTVRHALVNRRYQPAMVNGISMTLGGILALTSALLFEAPMVIYSPFKAMGIMLAIIIVGNVICHNLYAYLLTRYSATMLASAGFLGPLFASIYGYFLFGEVLTARFFIALAIIFAGIFIFYLGEKGNVNQPELQRDGPLSNT